MKKRPQTHRIWWITKIAVTILITLFFMRGAWESIMLPSREMQYYSQIKKHLTQTQYTGYSDIQVMRASFQIVAFSKMASGMMSISQKDVVPQEELLPLIDEIKARALSQYASPFGSTISKDTDFTTGGTHGLYLSHLNLILGIHQYLHQQIEPDPLNTKLTTVFHDLSTKENSYHVPSFQDGSQWPADQAVTLLSMYVYDQNNQTNYSAQPISDWLQFMQEHMIDPETGVYKSALGHRWYRDIPRGAGISWTIFYMAQFAPEEAQVLYQTYRQSMWQQFWGFGGFREWPVNRGGSMNPDTGPIMAGIGSAATALAIGPTRLMHDNHHYTLIMRMFYMLGIPHFSPLIGTAILFSGESATPWFTENEFDGYNQNVPSILPILTLYLSGGLLLGVMVLYGDVVARKSIRKLRNNWKKRIYS